MCFTYRINIASSTTSLVAAAPAIAAAYTAAAYGYRRVFQSDHVNFVNDRYKALRKCMLLFLNR